jgi:Zn-dependent peptidase ImmA (M78 family)
LSSLQPPWLTWENVREKAEEFRKSYVHPVDTVPVPIIEIVEFDIRLYPIPICGLLEENDIDGFLAKDLKNICIDKDIYENPRKENRLRFTYAHEVGHYVLHNKEIQLCKFRTPEDWKRFREDFDEEGLYWFEQQAYEFAGRLLVPLGPLKKEIGDLGQKIKEYRRLGGGDEDKITHAVARSICRKFFVSEEVVARRIKSEKIEL